MPKKKISGTAFEIYIYETVRNNFPLKEGWEILENKNIKVGKSFIRPDFVVKKRKITVFCFSEGKVRNSEKESILKGFH